MQDADCIAFLRWCLPRLGLRWEGYRRVRRTVCKRVGRRMRALGLGDLDGYRARLATAAEEWDWLDEACHIPISRLYRDRGVFDRLAGEMLPVLAEAAAADGRALRCWSAGCAAGEEPVTLRLIWDLRLAPRHPGVALELVATDADAGLLARAARGCYTPGALKDLPVDLRGAFGERDGQRCLPPRWQGGIDYRRQDIRRAWPEGPFDLVLCRNLAFTYFEPTLQRVVLSAIAERLRPGGALVLGRHEHLPEDDRFAVWIAGSGIHRRVEPAPKDSAPGDSAS